MTPTMRKALYGLIPLVVAALTTYGIFTDNLGVLWGNVTTLTVGFAFAASRATGDRFGDPEVRRALYVLVPAVVALIGGYWSVDVALWTSLAMAILGAALAGLNCVHLGPQGCQVYDQRPLICRLFGTTPRMPCVRLSASASALPTATCSTSAFSAAATMRARNRPSC